MPGGYKLNRAGTWMPEWLLMMLGIICSIAVSALLAYAYAAYEGVEDPSAIQTIVKNEDLRTLPVGMVGVATSEHDEPLTPAQVEELVQHLRSAATRDVDTDASLVDAILDRLKGMFQW